MQKGFVSRATLWVPFSPLIVPCISSPVTTQQTRFSNLTAILASGCYGWHREETLIVSVLQQISCHVGLLSATSESGAQRVKVRCLAPLKYDVHTFQLPIQASASYKKRLWTADINSSSASPPPFSSRFSSTHAIAISHHAALATLPLNLFLPQLSARALPGWFSTTMGRTWRNYSQATGMSSATRRPVASLASFADCWTCG